jgi:hypothetical protein
MPQPSPKPAFVIGVTGYMDIPEIDRPIIEARIRTVLSWLRANPGTPGSDATDPPAWWPQIAATPQGEGDPVPLAGLGLGKRRIILLTSLAPGADTIAAKVALEEGIEVVAPLPFPAEIYRCSSSFCGDQVAPGAQQEFDEIIASTTHPIDAFPVMLHTDQELPPDTRLEGFRADLEDSERCNLRYRAAGEFVATHSHLLIALYSAADDLAPGLETGAGTASIVHVRRSVPTVRIVPRPDDFPWTESGPVFHMPARSIKRIADPAMIDSDTAWKASPARLLPSYPAAGSPPNPANPPDSAAMTEALSELREIACSS